MTSGEVSTLYNNGNPEPVSMTSVNSGLTHYYNFEQTGNTLTNMAVTEDPSSYAITLTVPAPTGLTATLNAPNVDLSWTGVTGATGYKIETSTDSPDVDSYDTSTEVGFSTSTNTITKDSGSSGWGDSKIQSTQTFTVGTPFSFDFSPSASGTTGYIGLGQGTLEHNNGSNKSDSMKFAYFIAGESKVYELSDTTAKYIQGGFSASDNYRIAVESDGTVKYYRQASGTGSFNLEYTSANTASGTYYVQSNMHTNGQGFIDIVSPTLLSWTNVTANTGNTNTTYTHTAPTQNIDNYYQVKTLIGSGESSASSSANATVGGTPDAPTGLTATFNVTTADMDLAWTAPSNNNGSAITGYKIEVSTDGTNFTDLTANTGSITTTHIDTNPTMGSLNYYKVSAINAYGVDAVSNTDSDMAGLPPDAPTITTAIPNPNTAPLDIVISITNGASNGTGTITNYEIYRDSTLVATTGVVSSHTDTVPSGGGTFAYEVKTVTDHGTSALSSSVSQTTPTPPPAPSSAPTLDIANPDSNPFDVTVTYAMPSSGGSAINSFEIFRSIDDVSFTSVGTTTTLIFSDTVPNAGTFYYKFASTNLVGNSGQSPSSSIATPTVPVADSSVTLSIDNPNPNPLDVTVSFVAPSSDGGSAVLTYDLHSSPDDVTYTPIATGVTADQTVTVANAGTWYFKSLTTNNVGSSVLGIAVSIATPTVPVSDSSVTLAIADPNATPLDVTVSFTAPTSNGGSNVTGYNLSSSPDDSVYTQVATNVTADQTITVANDGTWYFKSQAINPVGTSAFGSSVSITTASVPSADSSVTLAIADPNATPLDVTVSFTAPTSNGGSNITGYNLSSSPDDSVYTQVATNVTADQTITVANAGTWYFKSQAINPVGTSAFGSSVSITTATVPVAITDLTTSAITNSAATLTWTEPSNGGSNIVLYKIIRDGVEIATSTATSYTDSSAVTQTSYVYAVISSNNVGDSATSNQLTVLISGVPDAPSLTVSQNSINSLDLSWSIPQDYASAITGYKIERNDGTGYVLELANTGSVSTSYTVNGLTPISEYSFKVSAINAYGIGPGGVGSNWTNPTAPTGFVVIPNSSTSTLDLSWDSNVSATGYKIEREIGIGNGWLILTANTGNTNTVYQDSGLTTNIFYNYRISTVTPVGNSIPSSTYAQTTFHLPDPVISLTADDGIPGSIALDWTAPAQPYGAIIGYTIYQVTAPGTTATATAVLSTTLDQLSSIQVTNVGVLYLTPPTVTISAPGGVAPYTQATATATITSFGSVSAITITNAGDGYNTPPTVTMNAPAGNTVVGSGTTLTPLVPDTLSTATSYSIAVADPATDYSFAVAPINSHGSTILGGQIVTASPKMTFEGLKINIDNANNPDVNPIIFEQTRTGTATNLQLTYGAALDVTCETTTPFTSTKSTYPNLSETPIGNGKVTHTMAFQNSDNTIVDVMCFDVNNTDIKAQSRIMQNEIPLKAQMDSFNANVFGTGSQFAAIDLMTLVVVIVGMIGFNRKNPAVGLALMAGLLGILSVFGIIQMEAGAIGGFILIVMFAFIMGWRRRG